MEVLAFDVKPNEEIAREIGFEYVDLHELLADHLLLRMRNVIVTPHTAFSTQEAVQRILDTTRGNIVGCIAGEPKNLAIGGNG